MGLIKRREFDQSAVLHILITKETRAAESRVAMIPSDVKLLISKGHRVFIEQNAGKEAGFSDQAYQNVGAEIRHLRNNTIEEYTNLFKNIDLIVRAKRPERSREILENQAISPGTIMIGALDPLEKKSMHVDEYHKRGIIAYSIDQLNLEQDDPMNVLAAMSKMAGKLAILDAIQKFHSTIKKLVIIGFGIVGRSAFAEGLKQKLSMTVIIHNPLQDNEIIKQGAQVLILNKQADLKQQQSIIKNALLDADIVITSARKANQQAPLLIPIETLALMKKGSVIVDMALSEGGNVEGSEHDVTQLLGNGIIVTNTSGYPKALPNESSKLWSRANRLFIFKLIEGHINLSNF